MTHRSKRAAAVALAMLVVGAAGFAADRGGDQAIVDAVLAVNAQMTAAAEAGNVDGLFAFMAETSLGSVVQNGEVLVTRQQALERTRASMRGVAGIKYRWNRQLVSVLSADVAVLTADGESHVTLADGTSFTAPFAQTVVFVRTDGRWKAMHAHQSSPRAR